MSNVGQLCPACGSELRPAPALRRIPRGLYAFLVVVLLGCLFVGWLMDDIGSSVAMVVGQGIAAVVILRAYIKGAKPGEPRRRCPSCFRTFAVSELPQS